MGDVNQTDPNEEKWQEFYKRLNDLVNELMEVSGKDGQPVVKPGDDLEIRVQLPKRMPNPVPEQITPKVIQTQME